MNDLLNNKIDPAPSFSTQVVDNENRVQALGRAIEPLSQADLHELCGENAKFFAKTFEYFHSDPCLARPICFLLKKTHGPTLIRFTQNLYPSDFSHTVESIEKIRETILLCGKNKSFFKESFALFDKNPEIVLSLAKIIGEFPAEWEEGYQFKRIEDFIDLARTLHSTPEEVYEVFQLCKGWANLFAETYGTFGNNDPELIKPIAAEIGALTDPRILNQIAISINSKSIEEVKSIVDLCGDNASYFCKTYELFGSDPKLIQHIAKVIGRSRQMPVFVEIANILGAKSPEYIEHLIELSGENACYFAETFLALKGKLESAEYIARSLWMISMDKGLLPSTMSEYIDIDKHQLICRRSLHFTKDWAEKENAILRSYLSEESSPIPWENYVVRKKDFSKEYFTCGQEGDYFKTQLQYGTMMHQSILLATIGVIHRQWNFDQLLEYLSVCRSNIAHSSHSRATHDYGEPVISTDRRISTFCKGIYEELDPRILKFYRETVLKNPQNKAYSLEMGEKGESIGYTKIGEINGEFIRLSSIGILENLPSGIYHTSPSLVSKILHHVSGLYEVAMKETEEAVLLENLGEIYWWMCEGKPWVLGDPSIAEMLIKTLWHMKTRKILSPWKEGLIPWCETILETDVKQFSKNFKNLFDVE